MLKGAVQKNWLELEGKSNIIFHIAYLKPCGNDPLFDQGFLQTRKMLQYFVSLMFSNVDNSIRYNLMWNMGFSLFLRKRIIYIYIYIICYLFLSNIKFGYSYIVCNLIFLRIYDQSAYFEISLNFFNIDNKAKNNMFI